MTAPGFAGSDRRRGKRLLAFGTLITGIVVFVALGIWQLERLAWKLDLIRTVDARINAEAVPAPGPAAWPEINAAEYAYLRVSASGRFVHDAPTFTQAVTRLGPGFWVMSPFRTDGGFVVLVNRGFVTREEAAALPLPDDSETTVAGLLRTSEPGGGFLRSNDPAAGRWYSRDVAAIAAARALGEVAPYFIDADASGAGAPVGGLTVVSFRNHHLGYALTWFTLAAMLAGWGVYLARDKWISRRDSALP